jgi:ubiquitin-like protein Pup
MEFALSSRKERTVNRPQRVHRSRKQPASNARPSETSGDSPEDQRAGSGVNAAREPTVSETEALLDEIDQVLESNAEDFVKSYVQKGGQ